MKKFNCSLVSKALASLMFITPFGLINSSANSDVVKEESTIFEDKTKKETTNLRYEETINETQNYVTLPANKDEFNAISINCENCKNTEINSEINCDKKEEKIRNLKYTLTDSEILTLLERELQKCDFLTEDEIKELEQDIKNLTNTLKNTKLGRKYLKKIKSNPLYSKILEAVKRGKIKLQITIPEQKNIENTISCSKNMPLELEKKSKNLENEKNENKSLESSLISIANDSKTKLNSVIENLSKNVTNEGKDYAE